MSRNRMYNYKFPRTKMTFLISLIPSPELAPGFHKCDEATLKGNKEIQSKFGLN